MPSQYTAEEVDRGLLALVFTGGNADRAHDLLKEAGWKQAPTGRTLLRWPITHADRYAQLQSDHSGQVADRIASHAEALALTYNGLQSQIAARLVEELHTLDAKELSGAARNIATAAALNIDKLSSPIRGRPNVRISDDRDGLDILRSLGARIPGLVHETTAHELPATQEIPSPSPDVDVKRARELSERSSAA